jgi:cell division protein FtsL
MKKVFKVVTLLALSAMLAIPVVSQAADKKTKNEIVMKMGNKVHLFHSSNVEAQKEIAIGDVLSVYRQYEKPRMQKNDAPSRAEKEVGAVKVLSFTGEHYFEAEIIKGEVKIGDVAKKDAISLLVQPAK